MPAGATYESISTTTLSATTTSLTISSIPSSYTDIVLVMSCYWSAQDSCGIRLNSDTGTNYSRTILTSDINNSVSTDRTTNANNINLGRLGRTGADVPFSYGTAFGTHIIHINNYSNTNMNKTVISRHSSPMRPSYGLGIVAGLWRSTAAVSSIELMCDGSSLLPVGSTFTLYGITAA